MTPLRLELELARAKDAGDPHAFRWGLREYIRFWDNERVQPAGLAWTDALSADLQALTRPDPPPEHLHRLGEAMRGFALAAGFGEEEPRVLAALAEGRPVELVLRFHAAELFALPWEAMPLGPEAQPLGRAPGALVRYAWPGVRAPEEHPLPRPAAARVLLAWSAAAGEVDAGAHSRALARAAREGEVAWSADQDELRHASLERLGEHLQAAREAGRPYSALHLLAHGAPLPDEGFGLALDGAEGLEVLGGPALGAALAPHADTLRLVVLSACSSGDAGPLGSKLGSVAQALHRAGVESVLASRLPLSMAGSARLAERLWQALLVELSSLEDATRAARQALLEGPSPIDAFALQLHGAGSGEGDTRPVVFAPYRGLLPFRREHRRFFFGRDNETREIVEDLRDLTVRADVAHPPILLVIGASGTGKSSLVLSGVLPQLESEKPGLRAAVMRPGSDPLGALERSLVGGEPQVLVVDQLEELFTHQVPPETQTALVQQVWALAEGGTQVLLTLRVDWLSRCGALRLLDGRSLEQIAYDERHRAFVSQLAGSPLNEAIRRPVERVGLGFAPGLAERVYEEVRQEPGALPLVQHALDLLWQRRSGHQLTHAACEDIGGVIGALRHQADQTLALLPPEQQGVARRLVVRLVRYVGEIELSTRRRLPLRDLRPAEEQRAARLDAVIEALVSRRLVVRDEGPSGETTLELAHEALIRRWPTLRVWLEEDWERVQALERLGSWVEEQRRFPAFVLRGEQLAAALDIRTRYGDELNAEMLALVDHSEATRAAELEAEAQRARKERRLTRGLVYGGAAFFLVGTGLLGWGKYQSTKADQLQRDADRNMEAAEAEATKADQARLQAATERKRADQARLQATTERTQADVAKFNASIAEIRAHNAGEAAERAQAEAERMGLVAASAGAAALKAGEEAREERAAAERALAALNVARAEADLALHLRVAATMLVEDPTLSAALLAEREDGPESVAWRRLALTALTYPLSSAVLDLRLGPITSVAELGGGLLVGTGLGVVVQADLTGGYTMLPAPNCAPSDPEGAPLAVHVRAWGPYPVARCADGRAWSVGADGALTPLHDLGGSGAPLLVNDAIPLHDGRTLVVAGPLWDEADPSLGIQAAILILRAPAGSEDFALVPNRLSYNVLDILTHPATDTAWLHTKHVLTGRQHIAALELGAWTEDPWQALEADASTRTLYRTNTRLTALALDGGGIPVVGEASGRVLLLRPGRVGGPSTLTQHNAAPTRLLGVGDSVYSGAADGTLHRSPASRTSPTPPARWSGFGTVSSLAAAPDTSWVAVGQRDGSLSVVPTTEAELRPIALRGHNDQIVELLYLGTEELLVSASADETVRLWPASQLNLQVKLPNSSGVVETLEWAGGQLIIRTEDQRAWRCNPPGCSGLNLEPWPAFWDPPDQGITTYAEFVAERTEGEVSLEAGDWHVRVWSRTVLKNTIQVIQVQHGSGPWSTLGAIHGTVLGLEFDPASETLFVGVKDGLYGAETFAVPLASARPGPPPTEPWSGRQALREVRHTGDDPSWERLDGAGVPIGSAPGLVLTRSPEGVLGFSTPSASTWLAQDTTVQVGGLGEPERVRFSPDGSRLSMTDEAGQLALVSVHTGEALPTPPVEEVRDHTWSPEGLLILGLASGEVLSWDPDTATLSPIGALERGVAGVVASPQGDLVAAWATPSGAEVWSLGPEGAQALGVPHTEGWLTAMLFSPDGAWLYLGSDLGEVVGVRTVWLHDPLSALRQATTVCVGAEVRASLLGEDRNAAAEAERSCEAGLR